MNRYSGRLMATAFVVLVAVSGAIAQENKPNPIAFDKARTFQALEKCLQRSDIPGFVDGALYTLIECKNRYPDLNYSQILNSVKKVEQADINPSLRYKAYLVSMYLTHSSDIQVAPLSNPDNHDYLFKQIADQLEQKFLAFNDGENIVVKSDAR